MATIRDVAKRAGVSVSTASIALSGRGPVSEATRSRVLEAAEALRYRPNAIARGLVTRKSRTVGLILPDITDPYFHEITKGVERVMADAGYTVILADTDRDRAKEMRSIDALLSHQVEGVILAGSEVRSGAPYRSLRQEGWCVVGVGRHAAPIPSVQVDNEAAAVQAVEHLIATGRRRIALISGPRDLAASEDRRRGFLRAVARHALEFDPWWEAESDFTPEGGRHAAYTLFGRSGGKASLPNAVFAANDQMAIGAIRGLRELGLSVPRDVAVAGIGDIPTARYIHPTLTTVSIPLERMGREAARLLLGLIGGSLVEETVRLDTRLVVRESTEPINERGAWGR